MVFLQLTVLGVGDFRFTNLEGAERDGMRWRFAFRRVLVLLFICGKNPDREVGDEELPESSWLDMVGG